MATAFSHRSVLLEECIDALAIKENGVYVDGTAGGGGHSFEIAKKLTTGKLVAIDRDDAAIAAATARLSPFSERATVYRSNFSDLSEVLDALDVEKIDGLLLDLGCSSHQFDVAERGFGYMQDAPLDMRMDRRAEKSAYTVVNTYTEDALKSILFTYGEEKFSARIARNIVAAREKKPIETTFELVEIIKASIPPAACREGGHPAKRTFQAIRIEVNGELDAIAPTIKAAVERMNKGGRIAIITFHSLEDRIVKQTFAELASGCTCPKTLPVCVCGKKPKIKLISKKPILPSAAELAENSRSRSAKLRVAEKL